jgi:STE24 endopeptidase
MTATTLTILFLVFLLAGITVRVWLATRQISHVVTHRDKVPEAFVEKIGLPSHQRAADYTAQRTRLRMTAGLFDVVILLWLTLGGGLAWFDTQLIALISNDLVRQVALIATVVVVLTALQLPFTIYRQFKLEAKFGFNRMTPALFITDTAKGLVLAVVLGLPLLLLILWLMQTAGTFWWLWAWASWAVFNLLAMLVFPTWIAPLFNKFTPLDNPALKDRIQALAKRCDFAIQGLFVMDGSKRSAHGNAYFTGFGQSRRIVFFDTLLAKLSPDEIEAVLAHELGHFKHKHIIKRLILSFTASLIMFAVLGFVATQPWFYQGLGVTPHLSASNDAMALLLFFLIVPVFTFALTPLMSWFSRKDEFEADRFAAKQSEATHLVSALVKLFDDNAATLTPDPLHSAFYDSHPPASIRIRQLVSA